jgi:hypothetical protein
MSPLPMLWKNFDWCFCFRKFHCHVKVCLCSKVSNWASSTISNTLIFDLETAHSNPNVCLRVASVCLVRSASDNPRLGTQCDKIGFGMRLLRDVRVPVHSLLEAHLSHNIQNLWLCSTRSHAGWDRLDISRQPSDPKGIEKFWVDVELASAIHLTKSPVLRVV